jgi:uncharacterized cupredoxin-like copper-binding protein
MTARRWQRAHARVAILVAVAALLAACGDDDDATVSSKSTDTTAAKAENASVEAPTYTITTHEDNGKYAFDVPSSMKGGVVHLVLDNSTGKEVHDFQLAIAAPGHTLDEALKQVASDQVPLEDWMKAAGGVGSAAPGQKSEATLELPAGTYWYFCTMSNEQTGASHAKNGMAGTLTVSGTSGADLPKTNATITAKDFAFDASGLHAGSNTVEFRNEGKQLHMALIAPLAPGATIDQVKAMMSAPPDADQSQQPSGPPPFDFSKAVELAVLSPGQSEVAPLELSAGRYAMICVMPNYGTAGPPHAAMGMVHEVDIT